MSIRKKRQLKTLRFFVYLYILLFSIAIPFYSALYLPPYTYLPFDIGTNLRENKHTNEEIETKLIYENIETGKRKTFAVEDTEWQDDTKWKYIDTETSGGGNTIAVTQLTLYNQNQENVTDTIIEDKGYTFMVVAQDIKDLEYMDITSLSNLYQMNEADKINIIVATASPLEASRVVLSSYGWQNIDVYNADIVELKSVLRNNKGVILINDGTIAGKWNFRQNIFKTIGYNDIKPLIDWEKNTINVYFIILGLFLAIMLYLVRLYHTIRR